MNAPSLQIDTLTSEAEIASIAPEWDRLVAEVACDAPFISRAWALQTKRSYEPSAQWRFQTIREHGALVGLIPWVRRSLRTRGLTLSELGFLRTPHSLRNEFLIAREDFCDTLSLCLRRLRGHSDWQRLSLENLALETDQQGEVDRAALNAGLAVDHWRAGRMHQRVSTTGSWEAYLATRSRSFRAQLKKFRKRAEALGPVSFECANQASSIDAQLGELVALETESRRAPELRLGERGEAFLRALAVKSDATTLGELWTLRIDGRAIAMLRLVGSERRLYVHIMTYSEAHAAIAPGFLLLARVIQSGFERSFDYVDLNGDSDFFRRFSNTSLPHMTTRLYARSAVGFALRVGSRAVAMRSGR